MSVAVVIVTYRPPPGALTRCVRSVLDHTPGARVIVVDNGEQASIALNDHLDQVDLIVADRNGGFGAGVNLGLQAALAGGVAHVAVLNDDVEVTAGWLEPLLEHLDANDRVGAVQPVLLNAGTGLVNSAGVQIDASGAGSDVGRDDHADEWSGAPREIAACTGGAVVFASRFLDDVGVFDERFFLYYEDVELARRGTQAGWSYAVVPASTVLHLASATTSAMGDDIRVMQERNRLWSSAMHGSPAEMVRAVWLSARRLRHQPIAAHRRAAIGGVVGMSARLFERAHRRLRQRLRARRLRGTPGVNIVGYHHISSGLGSNARELSAALQAAGIPVVEIDNDLSNSPRRRPARPVPTEVFDTTIAIVTAFEFDHFCYRFPELSGPGKRMIGYWVWELSEVPDGHRAAMRLVDELWTPTRFVQDAYGQVSGDVPVRCAPFRMEEPRLDPTATTQWRDQWGEDFVFLTSFDYLSIVERKNPLGVIDAFRAAFPVGDNAPVRLVVKSINGDQRPDESERVRQRAEGDSRIELLDAHLDDRHHHGLIAAADCFVSLHRSEGYGLQPAIAMWLETPVIATRYSGVVDFMDDTCGAMVNADLVNVTNGEGIYPETAKWADPDLTQAAAHMQRMVADDDWRAELVERARRRIADQPDQATFGEGYASILRTPSGAQPSTEPFFSGLDRARGWVSKWAGSRRGTSVAWPDSAR